MNSSFRRIVRVILYYIMKSLLLLLLLLLPASPLRLLHRHREPLQNDDSPAPIDQKALFGQMGFYQLPALSEKELLISFRTYVEYENRLFLPLVFAFTQRGETQFQCDFWPRQGQVGQAVSANLELAEHREAFKGYVETMQDELAKRILLMTAFYGRAGNLFLTKPQTSMALFLAKMVAVLKLQPVSIAQDRHSYEFAFMFTHNQLLFVSAEVDGPSLVSHLALIERQLVAQQQKQLLLFKALQNPLLYQKCEQESRPCEPRFKQVEDELDEEERKAKEEAIIEKAEIREKRKKEKRDVLKQFIQMEKLTGSVFEKQLLVYLTEKKDDSKIGSYLRSECIASTLSALKKVTKGDSAAPLLIASQKYQDLLIDDQAVFIKSVATKVGNKTEVDKELQDQIKIRMGALQVVASLQFKALQFNSYYDDALKYKKKNSKKQKVTAQQDQLIKEELAQEILSKGHIDIQKLKEKEVAKLKEENEQELANELKAKVKEDRKHQEAFLEDNILENEVDSSDFNDFFKVIEYKNVIENIKKGLDKDKSIKKAFLAKLNGMFFQEVGYPLQEKVSISSLKNDDLHAFALEKGGERDLPVSLARDQILDNYFYHGNYINSTAFSKLSYLDKKHLAVEQQLLKEE